MAGYGQPSQQSWWNRQDKSTRNLLILAAILVFLGFCISFTILGLSLLRRSENTPTPVGIATAAVASPSATNTLAPIAVATIKPTPRPTETRRPVNTKPPLPTKQPTNTPEPPATSAPTLPPAPTPLPQNAAVYQNTNFSFAKPIAASASGKTVPATIGEDMPGFDMPEHSEFSFAGYALANTFHEAKIFIYPIADFEAVSEPAAKQIQALRDLLAAKPAPTADKALPFLPRWPAAQLFHLQFLYLDSENSHGIRYLAEYGQDYAPANNTDLFYTYQGITNDGKYYIAAILPVAHPSLPENRDKFTEGYEALVKDYPGYVSKIQAQLNPQPAENFTPNLALLDAMMRSVAVK